MKTLLKTMWMHSLLFGISVLCVMMSRCNKPDDWNLTPLDVDFTFNNETDSSISFTIVNYITYEDVMVRLSPKSSSEVFSFEAETDKVPDVNDC